MNRLAPEVWANLEEVRPTGDRLAAKLGIPSLTDRLECGLDASDRRHLLIKLSLEEDELKDSQSRGLMVNTRELTVRGGSPSRYLDIECHDITGYPAFDLIGGEIAEELAHSGLQPAEIIRRVLGRWRRFWGQLPQELLSREEQLGLFAELWFLSVWLIPKIGTSAVSVWRGPWGARHDFEFPDKSIEVKATTSTRGRIHRIHGLNQLEAPENGPLYLFSLRLREEAGATNTVPGLIDLCHSQLQSNDEALAHFESGLFQMGYSPIHQDEYLKLSLHTIEEALFTVRDDFPRLNTALLPSGLPSSIERVEYDINLSAFNHLILARDVSAWSP